MFSFDFSKSYIQPYMDRVNTDFFLRAKIDGKAIRFYLLLAVLCIYATDWTFHSIFLPSSSQYGFNCF
jgi:hypothetical protein